MERESHPNKSLEIFGLFETSTTKVAQIFANIAFYGLFITIFWTAIPYGTVEPWSKLMFAFIACIFAVFRILEGILTKTSVFTNKVFFFPLVGIIFLAAFQIIPSNPFAEIFRDVTDTRNTISIDVYETKNFILIFIGLIITGEVLLRYTTTTQRIRHLMYLVFAISLGCALFGFARLIFPNAFAALLNENIQFAQFVNRNHFTYLMEMNLGLLLGLQFKAQLDQWQRPIYWTMTAISSLAIIMTNSRGGILCMVGLSIFAVFLFFSTRETQLETENNLTNKTQWFSGYFSKFLLASIFSIILLGMSVFIVAFVGGDPVVSRIETVQNEVKDNSDGKIRRREIWQATFELIKSNPIVGIGFGAYPIAITVYDKSSGQWALKQAHNDYLEILANGGLVGFCLMLIFIMILLKRVSSQIKTANNFRQATCMGAVTGIFGVMLHSFVEFGLHVIINALVFTVLIVIAIAKVDSADES